MIRFKYLKSLGLLFVIMIMINSKIDAQTTLSYRGAISLYELFKLDPDLSYTFSATNVSNSNPVTIKVYSGLLLDNSNWNNILLYEMTSVSQNTVVSLAPTIYANPSTLGIIGNNYPVPWSSDNIKASSLALKNYYLTHTWREKNPNNIFNDFLGSAIPVNIEISIPNGVHIQNLRLPGIGYVYQNNVINKGLRFDIEHHCNQNQGDFCDEWIDLKNPPDSSDLKLAAHRGFWGNNLGSGPIENTEPAIQAASSYTKIMEADVMMTADKKIIVSHDYNLQRLTEYNEPGYDNAFIYNLNYNQIKDLHLRKRNYEIDPAFKVVQLSDLLDYIINTPGAILTIDIKEITKRLNPIDNTCTAACDVTRDIQAEAWMELLSKLMEVVKAKDAWKYVAVKTPYTMTRIKASLPRSQYRDLSKMLFFPVYYSNRQAGLIVSDINDWYNNAPNHLATIETNFKKPGDVMLNPYQNYDNILHYVVKQTALRPGLYSEEPGGPKGVVERYAQWRFKNLSEDFRGDPYWLMDDVPYFSTSVITTDRPDMWRDIKNIYEFTNNQSVINNAPPMANTYSTNIESPRNVEKITVFYKDGKITIDGLNDIDLGSNILLYNLQGYLIANDKVLITPQTTLSKNLQGGVYILKLSGNRQVGVKLMVNP